MKKTKTYYAIELTKRGAKNSKFALYEIDKNGKLKVVWGHPLQKKNLKTNDFKIPYHYFLVPHIGYNKLFYLSELLKADVLSISGWSPSGHV